MRFRPCVIALAVLFAVGHARAAGTIYGLLADFSCVSYPNITGAMGITGFSFGGSTNAATGRGQLADITITKPIDNCSPRLFQFLASGRIIHSVTIVVLDSNSRELLRIDLTDVFVSGVKGGDVTADSAIPSEQIAFRYNRITLEYVPTHTVAGWDVSRGTAI